MFDYINLSLKNESEFLGKNDDRYSLSYRVKDSFVCNKQCNSSPR